MGLQAINKFKLYDFPAGEERTYAQLANKSGASEEYVRRMIRQAATSYIFKEPRPGVVAHSAASSAIGTVPMLSQWLGMVSEELYPAAARVSGQADLKILLAEEGIECRRTDQMACITGTEPDCKLCEIEHLS